jgi:hypothetical protein
VIALGGGSLIAAGALAWNQPAGSGTAVFFGFLTLIVIFNVANAIAVVRRAYRAADRNRYVLTNRRAAVFETPGHLVTFIFDSRGLGRCDRSQHGAIHAEGNAIRSRSFESQVGPLD